MPGHVTKRGKSSWSVVVDLGRDPLTGKRRQLWRSVKGTKRDAEALLVQLLHQRDHGIDEPVSKLTVGAWLERWLSDSEPHNALKTQRTNADIVRRHLIPVLGNVPLTKLKPVHVQSYLSGAMRNGRLDGKGGLSAKSAHRHYQVLHAALHRAVRLEVIARNPADAVELPRVERKQFRALTPAEVRTVYGAADATTHGPLVRLAVLTGLRQGELLGLRWSDVDLGSAVLSVQQTLQAVPGKGISFRDAKTRSSRRNVALSADTCAALRMQRGNQLSDRLAVGMHYEDRGLVFQTPLGTPMDPSNVRRAWRSIVKKANIGHIRFHDLRHSHASLMLAAGTNIKIVSERLGHASTAITGDIYAHVLPGMQAAAAEQLDRLLAVPIAEAG